MYKLDNNPKLPLPEKGFIITNGAISGGIDKNLKIGDKSLTSLSHKPLAVNNSLIINIPTRYGNSEYNNGSAFFIPKIKLS